jgi:hypothetical protein
MKHKKGLSRRDFIRTTAVGLGATAMTGFGANNARAKDKSSVKKWDHEADVVVVGYGGAGIVAAITAHDAGAKVLVLEKAPFRGGGSTSMSFGQCASPSNAKDAADYLYAGCGGLNPSGSVTPREVIEAWAEEVCKNKEWFDKMGIEHKVMTKSRTEFMNLPGGTQRLKSPGRKT